MPSQPITYQKYESGNWQTIAAETILETPVALTVNGEVWLTFMCTPVHLEALAIGFLFNEGILASMSEIADVRVCEHGDNIDIWTNRAVNKPKKWTRTSGCTGGQTSLEPDDPQAALPLNGFVLTPEVISRLVDMLFESQSLYKETGGVHTSALSDGESILLAAEDIGRHNTLDKLAGLTLMGQGSPLPENKIIITTGRISSEMLQKAHRLGAQILISRTSPSSLSIQMAEQRGITLIGYARRHRFNVYTHPQRVSGAG
jgi:FdhD protein